MMPLATRFFIEAHVETQLQMQGFFNRALDEAAKKIKPLSKISPLSAANIVLTIAWTFHVIRNPQNSASARKTAAAFIFMLGTMTSLAQMSMDSSKKKNICSKAISLFLFVIGGLGACHQLQQTNPSDKQEPLRTGSGR